MTDVDAKGTAEQAIEFALLVADEDASEAIEFLRSWLSGKLPAEDAIDYLVWLENA